MEAEHVIGCYPSGLLCFGKSELFKHCIKFESLSILLLYWWKIVKLCEFVKVDNLDFILFNK